MEIKDRMESGAAAADAISVAFRALAGEAPNTERFFVTVREVKAAAEQLAGGCAALLKELG